MSVQLIFDNKKQNKTKKIPHALSMHVTMGLCTISYIIKLLNYSLSKQSKHYQHIDLSKFMLFIENTSNSVYHTSLLKMKAS